MKKDDFAAVSNEILRTNHSCFAHWQGQILPILKKHMLGLPQGQEWMKKFLIYLTENKVKDTEKIEYSFLVENKFPGETNHTLIQFANHRNRSGIATVDGNGIRSKEPLHETCLRELKNPSVKSSYLGNEKMANAHLEYAKEIVTIYKSLITTT